MTILDIRGSSVPMRVVTILVNKFGGGGAIFVLAIVVISLFAIIAMGREYMENA